MSPQGFRPGARSPLASPCYAIGRKSKNSTFIVTLLYYINLKQNKRCIFIIRNEANYNLLAVGFDFYREASN